MRSSFICRVIGLLSAGATAAAAPATGPVARGGPVTFELALYLPREPGVPLASALRAVHDQGYSDLTVIDAPPPPGGPALRGRDVPVDRYAVPDLERLRFCGVGLSPDRQRQLQAAAVAWVVDFGVRDPAGATALVHRSCQFMAALADRVGGDAAGVVVWDDTTDQAFSVRAWSERRVGGWSADGLPDVSDQLTIH